MILRRIIAHFRKQEWTAIGIDFVIVVLGVFVATQVADWSAREADKRRGEIYLRQLAAEVEADQRARQRLIAYYDAVNEGAVRANDLLEQSSPDPRELVINAYRATEYAYYATSHSTWDEVVASGDVALIPNDVRVPIEAYLRIDSAQGLRETFNASAYRQIARRLITYDVQSAMRANCSDQTNERGAITGFPDTCDLSSVDEAEIIASARALRDNPQVLADLRYQISDLATAHADLQRDVDRGERALEALRAAAQ